MASDALPPVAIPERHADVVVLLLDGEPLGGTIVEVQRFRSSSKKLSWPSYATTLRARLKREVCLLMVAHSENVARWAAEPIDLGGGNVFTPLVAGPAQVPHVTNAEQALTSPEMAVLSALMHGKDADMEKGVRIAMAAERATLTLDDERGQTVR